MRTTADVLVICTRNRPREINLLLSTLAGCLSPPDIVIWDASDNPEPGLCSSRDPAFENLAISWMKAPRVGLARQRNDASAHCWSNGYSLVHFLDDDSIPERGYFVHLREALSEQGVVGAGGVITNELPGLAEAVRIPFLAWTFRTGRVLRSGRAVTGQYGNLRHAKSVAWLSGCSMSWRLDVVLEHQFDDRLEGYSFREDVDFGTRVSSAGGLLVAIPAARLQHYRSPVERWSLEEMTRANLTVIHAWCEGRGWAGLSRFAFWWATFGEFLLRVLEGGTVRKGDFSGVRGTLRGAQDVLKAGRP